jgi:hypothetical protein
MNVMRRVSFHNLPDAQFMAFANNICKQCRDHVVEWKIDEARLADLEALTAVADKAYRNNMNRSISNRITSARKSEAFAELKRFLSPFINYLEGNVAVSDEALEMMQLRSRVRVKRQPLPVPMEAPLVSIVPRHDEMVVYVSRSEHGQPTHGVEHKPYHGFKLRWKFEGETEWRIGLSTRLYHTLYFEAKDEGRRVILAAAWMNPRLQEGPWSASVTKVVG